MLTLIVKYWRPIAVVVGLAGAFMIGRYTTPGPDVVIAQSIRFVERRVEVVKLEKARDRIVYRNIEIRPDGTKIDRSIERTETETKVAKTTTNDRDSATDTKQTITAYKPQWRVGALLGFNVGGVHLSPLGVTPDAFAYGAFAERRVIGPFFVGLWGLSTGPSFGLTVSGEF